MSACPTPPTQETVGATLLKQRTDFLLPLPNRRSVSLELDEKQHYSDSQNRAEPVLYAKMARKARKLRLAGYEVLRFGGTEFVGSDQAEIMLRDLFRNLLALSDSINYKVVCRGRHAWLEDRADIIDS